MKFQNGDFVKIKKTGEVGRVDRAYSDPDTGAWYIVETLGDDECEYLEDINESDLEVPTIGDAQDMDEAYRRKVS